MLKLKNLFELDTTYGTRSFKLMEGSAARPGLPIDVLLVSAFARAYDPVPGTLLGALHDELGFLVASRLQDNAIDLRKTFGTLLLPVGDKHIRHVLVVEMKGFANHMKDVWENVYLSLQLLEHRGLVIRTMAMPPLGTGLQRIALQDIVQEIIGFSRLCLSKVATLEQVLLISNEPAKTQTLDEAMNLALGRPQSILPVTDLLKNLKADISTALTGLTPQHRSYAKPLNDVLRQKDTSVTLFAIEVRRFLEQALGVWLPAVSEPADLFTKINQLRLHQVAPWVISYFHVLRTFCNEYAHATAVNPRKPMYIASDDFTLAMFTLQRVVDFLTSYEAPVAATNL